MGLGLLAACLLIGVAVTLVLMSRQGNQEASAPADDPSTSMTKSPASGDMAEKLLGSWSCDYSTGGDPYPRIYELQVGGSGTWSLHAENTNATTRHSVLDTSGTWRQEGDHYVVTITKTSADDQRWAGWQGTVAFHDGRVTSSGAKVYDIDGSITIDESGKHGALEYESLGDTTRFDCRHSS